MSNLLPPQEIKRITLLYRKRFVVVAMRALMILVIIAGIGLLPSYIYSQKEQQELLAQKAVFDSKETGELKQTLISSIADINTRLNSFNEKSFSSPVIASFIDPVLKARVPSVYLSDFNYSVAPDATVAKIDISGVSTSREAILSFADNLRNTPGIVNVDVPITNFIKESNIPFSITITVSLK